MILKNPWDGVSESRFLLLRANLIVVTKVELTFVTAGEIRFATK